jgi:elongation factor G
MTADHVGKLTYFRVYSGKLTKGDQVLNTSSGNKERMGRLLEMHANDQIEQEWVGPGRHRRRHRHEGHPHGRHPVRSVRLHRAGVARVPRPRDPRRGGAQDQGRPGQDVQGALSLSEEDPTFQVRTDEETAETIIAGMGELHLEVLVDRMLREFKVDATVGKPQVAYRETLTQEVIKHTYLHKKQTGGSGQYAKIVINVIPTGPGGGFSFDDNITGGRIPKEYIPSVGHGVEEAITSGVLAGFPMVDVKVELTDGDYHDVDSSEMAFKIAGTMAFKEAARKAKPRLLEPIMAVEVVTPEEYMGDVIGDLNSRRGKVGKMEQRGANQVIDAEVPLSEMFGYSTDLRSKTQGRANYTMHFGSYQATPRSIQEEIVARVTGR